MKLAVVTSFGQQNFYQYASVMLEGFARNWPQDVPLHIYADPDCDKASSDIVKLIGDRKGELILDRTPEREEWLKRHKVTPDTQYPEGKDYRKHYVRFSHKVWAIYHFMMENPEAQKADYVVWLDADVVTHKPVTQAHIDAWLPKDGQFVSYMGRKDWDDPETGFIIFRNDDAGREFVKKWYNLYETDKLLLEDCWTDAHAFEVTQMLYDNDKMHNLTAHVSGRDVFDDSPMAEVMHHLKGPKRKAQLMQAKHQDVDPTEQITGHTLDINNMGIGTVNNMPMDGIISNVQKNLRLIENWIDYCQPNDEEIVICSAGPSLNYEDLKPWIEKGAKIVAVKHAMDRLQAWGVKPWACILLDGRHHVGDFVDLPDKDVLYIVASMVDPKVAQRLNAARCRILGYHAYVGSEVMSSLPAGTLLIGGGSATSTRGIDVLHTLGFRKFHIYGMDCCYFEKPDLAEVKDNGKLRYMEVTLSCETWGDKQVKRTFWTEGQFLAQIQEFKKMYLPKTDMEIHAYGDGAIAWTQKHYNLHRQWLNRYEDNIKDRIANSRTLEDLIRGINKSGLPA